jgi:hypothetical protein
LGATILPEDDAQARYFGLCVLALEHIALLQAVGLLEQPDGCLVIEDDVVALVDLEIGRRGFHYSDDEIAEKGWELLNQWAGHYRVMPTDG